ncbi:hypothetical protein [uncultured Tateyamaria sp.]|uniref:helix-turn-helix transcriptional regulator n=1 Tax=uncultured Tateyamaria sp. TaxID=455651 RepID=UPI002622CD5F|nr:hypothetical protein [uncultured Tateyamaria sp.]
MEKNKTKSMALGRGFDPTRLDELFAALASRKEENRHSIDLINNIESTLTMLSRSLDGDPTSRTLLSQINEFEYPAFVVDSTGTIRLSNSLADRDFAITWGNSVDSLGVQFIDGDSFSCRVQDFARRKLGRYEVKFHPAIVSKGAKSVNLALVPLAVDSSLFLVIFARHLWSNVLSDYLIDIYGFTRAEKSIIKLFCEGKGLVEIAKNRNRSVATVRKQFYDALDKCGVNSQAEFLLLLFQIQARTSLFNKTLLNIQRPLSSEFLMPRPGRRSLQFFTTGAADSRLVILLSSDGVHSFSSSFDMLLRNANITLVSLIRPGMGKTSPEGDYQDYFSCIVGDFISILDQYEQSDAVLYAPGTSFRDGIEIAARAPNRVRHVLSTTPGLSNRYLMQTPRITSFIDRMRVLVENSSEMRKFVALTVFHTVTLLGCDRFLRIVYLHNPTVLDIFRKTGVMKEISNGLKATFAQGTDFFVNSLRRVAEDWDWVVDELSVPITIYEASAGGLADSRLGRCFMDMFPGHVRYLELQASTGTHVHQYPRSFIEVIESCFQFEDPEELGKVIVMEPTPEN